MGIGETVVSATNKWKMHSLTPMQMAAAQPAVQPTLTTNALRPIGILGTKTAIGSAVAFAANS